MGDDHSDIESFPTEWPMIRVREFASVKGGKRLPARTALVQIRTSHPYLRVVDFKDGRIDKTGLMYVPDEVFPRIARYTISSKDIYISIVGTIGLVGLKPRQELQVSWADTAPQSVSRAELGPDTRIYPHRAYWRTLGIPGGR